MTERIVDYLSALVSTVGDIDTVHCLAERRTINDADNNKTEIPYVYANGGNYRPVEVDGGSVSYWRLGSPISMTEGEGFSVPKPLSATYPLRFFAIVNRDNINPLTYSQDVANVLQQENSTDLRTQLGAKRVKITVNAVETETSKLWREEFKVPVEDLHYTRAMIAIDVTVNVVANRECWVNCDSYPDILQGFPWCSETEATIDRLTPEQIACVENYLCEIVPCNDATYTNSDGSYSGSVASGANLDIPNIDFTDSDGTTTSVPSVQNIVATPIPPCADATVQLNGTTVGTIPSGDSDSFAVNLDGSPSGVWDGTAWQVTSTPCADATVELNGVEMTTIPSGDTENISIRQSSGATEVGSKQGVHWRIDDSAISINGSPVADVKAEDSLDIDVTQDGLPVGSWNGSEWVIPTVTGGATLEIGVFSDAGATIPIVSADFGDTVYIKLTVVGITPTNYRFFICENNVNFNLIEQASNIYAQTISTFNDLIIYGEAEDGSIAACALDATTLTINADADANAFIAAHNAASGQVMAILQQEVIQGTFQRLKGTGTTYGSDLWTKLSNSNSEIYPYTPVSDSIASAAAYAVDMINPDVLAVFNNFIPADYSVNGVIGNPTKYLAMKRSPSDYDQNSIGADTYGRNVSTSAQHCTVGASASDANGNATLVQTCGVEAFKVNSTLFTIIGVNNLIGLSSINRTTSTTQEYYNDGVLTKTAAATSLTPTTTKFYGHAYSKSDLTSDRNSNQQLAMVASRCGFTAFEMNDWFEVWDYYQTNIITGGRNV
jgi:hypothetical protein